ncbi:MAG: hypothetical protein RI101_00110 [Nitrospira sp.]|jgi:hypothetical protein|nr:hypothetical protein [Nitrospira sp.]
MSRRTKFNAIIAIVSLVLSFALAEIACRLLLPRLGFVARGSDDLPGLWIEHPVRGYTYSQNFTGTMSRDDFTIIVKTNEQGLRVGESRNPLDRSRPIVLAVGDSLTVGWGVQYEQAWPAQLERSLNAGQANGSGPLVVNAGVSGYSMRQIRQFAMSEFDELHPRVLMVGVAVAAIDRLRDPYVLFNGILVRESSLPHLRATTEGYLFSPMYRPWMKGMDFWFDEHCCFGSYLWKGLYKAWGEASHVGAGLPVAQPEPSAVANDGHLQLLLDELEVLRVFTQEKMARLVIVPIAGQAADGTFSAAQKKVNERVLVWCREKNVMCIDILSLLDAGSGGEPIYRFKNDSHWNALAHRVAAEEMAKRFPRDTVPVRNP